MIIFYTSGTFVAPSGVTDVIVKMWSGGNGGYGGNTGANGMYAEFPSSVTPTNSYTVTVGVGGSGNTGLTSARIGGTSSFNGIWASQSASNAPFNCKPQNTVPYGCRETPGSTIGSAMGGDAFVCYGGCNGNNGLVVIYY